MTPNKPVPRRRHDPDMANYVYKGDERERSEKTDQLARPEPAEDKSPTSPNNQA